MVVKILALTNCGSWPCTTESQEEKPSGTVLREMTVISQRSYCWIGLGPKTTTCLVNDQLWGAAGHCGNIFSVQSLEGVSVTHTCCEEICPLTALGWASCSEALCSLGSCPELCYTSWVCVPGDFSLEKSLGLALSWILYSSIAGTLVSHVTLRLMKPECELDESWCQEELPVALNRVVSLLHAHTIPSRTSKGEPGMKYGRYGRSCWHCPHLQ